MVGAKSGLAVGLNKGHVVTVREQKQRPSRRKGVGGRRTAQSRPPVPASAPPGVAAYAHTTKCHSAWGTESSGACVPASAAAPRAQCTRA